MKTCHPSHNPRPHHLQRPLLLPKGVLVTNAEQILRAPTCLFYSCYLAVLLVLVLLPVLSCFVKVADEAFLISLMAQAILMLCSRGCVIRDENLAVFAPVFLM